MPKLVRCIEGHVYDREEQQACPTCGAVPIDTAGPSGPGAGQGNESKRDTAGSSRRWLLIGAIALAVAAGAFLFKDRIQPTEPADREQDPEKKASVLERELAPLKC